jgi:hypothetical protein
MGDIIPDVSDVFSGGLDPTAADYPLAADLSGGFAGGGGFDPLGFTDGSSAGGGFFGPGDLSAQGTGVPAGFSPTPGDLGGQNIQNLQTQVSPGPNTTNIPETESAPAPAPNPLSSLIPPQGPAGLGNNAEANWFSTPAGGAPGVTPFNAQTVGGNVVPGTATPAIAGTTLEGGNYGPVPPSAAAQTASAPSTPLPTTRVSTTDAPGGGDTSAPAAQTAAASNDVAAGNAAAPGGPGAGTVPPGAGGSQIGQALAGMGMGAPLQRMLGDFFQLLSGHGNPMGVMQDLMSLLQMVMGRQGGMQQGGPGMQRGGPGMQRGERGMPQPGQVITGRNGERLVYLGNGMVRDQYGNVWDGNGNMVRSASGGSTPSRTAAAAPPAASAPTPAPAPSSSSGGDRYPYSYSPAGNIQT